MIGLSISHCVWDMVKKPEQYSVKNTERIITASVFRTPAATDQRIAAWRNLFWSENADAAEKIFRELLTAGKIEQSIITRGKKPKVWHDYHWVRSEEDIVWTPVATTK